MGASDRLWIHETVVNRTHVQLRSLSFEHARRLYEDLGYDLSFL